MKPKHETKPTPGPWSVVIDAGKELLHVRDAQDKTVADLYVFSHGPTATEANARLIAAAPELLEALVDLLGGLSLDQRSKLPMELQSKVANAIRKATGGAE